jgi:hypothetical protein
VLLEIDVDPSPNGIAIAPILSGFGGYVANSTIF